jgi:nitroimidazol reductase NimA-like FMN-containing flavoprotein (pyridoxamine 5'-phosphate oxidase superfamily)
VFHRLCGGTSFEQVEILNSEQRPLSSNELCSEWLLVLCLSAANGLFGCAGDRARRSAGHSGRRGALNICKDVTSGNALEHTAVKILNEHRIMAVSTVRPDGWPQTTVVGYANRGFDIFFLIFRTGQKLANIQHDDRISIAVAAEPAELSDLKAVYAGAHAKEITDAKEREEAWTMLMQRHSNLGGFQMPDAGNAAFMRAACKYVSVLDFSQGLGHRDQLTIDDQGVPVDIPD